MFKGTPGPWTEKTVGALYRSSKREGALFLEVRGGTDLKAEAQHNGNLLLAAPDLLASCRPVLKEAEQKADYLHDSWNPNAHVELTLTIAEIRAIHAAIAKALSGGAEGEVGK